MKKILKSSMSLLLAITLILGSAYAGFSELDFGNLFAVKASAAYEFELSFALNSDGMSYSVSGYSYDGDVACEIVIPSFHNGLPVTSILGYAFTSSYISAVSIPGSVKTISDNAFYSCDNLISVSFSEGLTDIGEYAFSYCTALVSVDVPDSVTSIGRRAFYSCTSLASITVPDGVILGEEAFVDTAYYNNPNSWINGILYVGNQLIATDYTSSGDLVIKDGVLSIPASAFIGCEGLTSVSIPDSVISVGDYAFASCSNLSSISIGSSVVSIGENAFSMCENLLDINISASVTRIGASAFEGCYSLTNVYIDDVESWCNITFVNEYSYPLKMARYLYVDGELVTEITIPESVTDIPAYAFSCENIEKVNFQDGLRSIGSYAFAGCTNLKNINIPCGVICIEDHAFRSCENLESVTIPNSVTRIGKCAFYYCSNLNGVTIPTSVISIENSAFEGCTSLGSIRIESDQTSFGQLSLGYLFRQGSSDTYSKYDGFTIYGIKDTEAEQYAIDNGFSFVEIEGSHKHERSDWITNVNESCTATGSRYKKCLLCGQTLVIEYVPATGHRYSEQIIDIFPTCTSSGSYHMNCSQCGDVIVGVIPQTGHNFSIEWTSDIEPTCTGEGSASRHCANCDQVVDEFVVPAKGHDYSADWIMTTPPTCSDPGIAERSCSRCDEKITVIGNSQADVLVDSALYPESTHNYENNLSETYNFKYESAKRLVLTFSASTFVENNWDFIYIYDETGAQVGKYTGSALAGAIIELKGSSFSIKLTSDTSVNKYGFSFDSIVAKMNEIDGISPLGQHEYGEWTTTPPTCTTDGSRHKTCSKCGDVVTETIESTGHDYSTDWIIDSTATCVDEGSKSRHCSVCGDKTDVMTIPTGDHVFLVVSAETEHPHFTQYKCAHCPVTKQENVYMPACVLCNFTYTNNDDGSTCRITGYIGESSSFVMPADILGRTVVNTTNGAFRNLTNITSVTIEYGVTGIGSAAFMGCSSLSKIIIPASVKSIGSKAFLNCASDFTIYCYRDSDAHTYAINNGHNYYIMPVGGLSGTTVDYANEIIFTNHRCATSIDGFLYVPESSDTNVAASVSNGNGTFIGTGSTVSVVDNGTLSSEYTIIVDGDTNGDSVCDALDAAQVALVSGGHASLDGAYKMAADDNADDVVGIEDYQAIVNKIVA